MKHFQTKTHGGALIMGRKTWQSLPIERRPLPGRINIIITSDRWHQSRPDLGLYYVDNFATAQSVAYSCKARGIFVIGGAAMIEQYQECASEAWVTNFKYDGPFDVAAPVLDKHWQLRSGDAFADGSTVLFRYTRG